MTLTYVHADPAASAWRACRVSHTFHGTKPQARVRRSLRDRLTGEALERLIEVPRFAPKRTPWMVAFHAADLTARSTLSRLVGEPHERPDRLLVDVAPRGHLLIDREGERRAGVPDLSGDPHWVAPDHRGERRPGSPQRMGCYRRNRRLAGSLAVCAPGSGRGSGPGHAACRSWCRRTDPRVRSEVLATGDPSRVSATYPAR